MVPDQSIYKLSQPYRMSQWFRVVPCCNKDWQLVLMQLISSKISLNLKSSAWLDDKTLR